MEKEHITVESVTPVDWRGSSLGCPRRDLVCLDVVTPGVTRSC